MSDQWYYTHGEAIHGPVSGDELRRRVLSEVLLPEDLVWPADVDPTAAVPVGAALALSPPIPLASACCVNAATPAPDWVSGLTEALAGVSDPAVLPNPSPATWLRDVLPAKPLSKSTERKPPTEQRQ